MSSNDEKRQLNERLTTSGLRSTTQRQHVYEALLERRDHPTAEELFLRVKQAMPEISVATVYNSLDALVKCNLVRQVAVERGAKRYCPNMEEHFHFCCELCHRIFDIDIPPAATLSANSLPPGFELTHLELSLRGRCADCSAKHHASHSLPRP